jgi:hypothetical protein
MAIGFKMYGLLAIQYNKKRTKKKCRPKSVEISVNIVDSLLARHCGSSPG